MGYTVTLVDSPPRPIAWDELAQAGRALGWQVHAPEQEIRLDRAGRLLTRVTLDQGEASAISPDPAALAALIALAGRMGLRLRGDEGESYRSPTETYIHPDDAGAGQLAPSLSPAAQRAARQRQVYTALRVLLLAAVLAGFALKVWLDSH